MNSADVCNRASIVTAWGLGPAKPLARDPSASLEDWQKLARTGKKIGFIMGEIGKRLAKF